MFKKIREVSQIIFFFKEIFNILGLLYNSDLLYVFGGFFPRKIKLQNYVMFSDINNYESFTEGVAVFDPYKNPSFCECKCDIPFKHQVICTHNLKITYSEIKNIVTFTPDYSGFFFCCSLEKENEIITGEKYCNIKTPSICKYREFKIDEHEKNCISSSCNLKCYYIKMTPKIFRYINGKHCIYNPTRDASTVILWKYECNKKFTKKTIKLSPKKI